jgi:cell division transport system ATP-binding protein
MQPNLWKRYFMTQPIIEFKHIIKRYRIGQGEETALNRISFALQEGDIAFLTGHSGAGKSTLLKLILMLEQPSAGEISLHGKKIAKLAKRKIPKLRRNIGFIAQNPKLLNQQTLFDNVALPLIINGYGQQEIAKRVRASLSMVGLLSKQQRFPHGLSCGEQQRLGIARAIVSKPSILLADEPTGNLDPSLSAEIMQLFEKLNQVGVTILIATHDLSLIGRINHKLMTLEKGRLV